MKFRMLICFAVFAGVAHGQPSTTPTTGSTIATLPYDSPLVRIIGDGRAAPFLAPIASLPDAPVRIPAWGPRAFAATGRLPNMSFRASIGPNVPAIGGFVVSRGGCIVLIRAVGPSLSAFGISGFVPTPLLQLVDAAGALVATAVPWSSNSQAIRSELQRAASLVGAFALQQGSADQVLLVYLDIGSYSCVVTGVGDASGVVLLEAYEVPSDSDTVIPRDTVRPRKG